MSDKLLDMKMLYHTALRNVGVFFTASLGALAVSRHYTERKNKKYSLISLLIGLLLVSVSCLVSYFMYLDHKERIIGLSPADKQKMSKWEYITMILMLLNSVCVGIMVYRIGNTYIS